MTEKLSTGTLSHLKKAEGKKRKSPCTPYREKGKGKENKPGASSTGLIARAGAHVRGALLRRHVNAAVEDALVAFCGKRGPAPSDEALWSEFAWKFGVGKVRDLCHQATTELDQHRGSMPQSKWPSVLQNVLNPFWNARFPKKGGAR
jgi:hypothetical protein